MPQSRALHGWVGSAVAVFAVVLAAPLMGCGMLGSLANPKVGFALQETTPMDVVLRRQSAAETTATAEIAAVGKSHAYAHAQAPVRVLPAEAWSRVLPGALKGGSGSSLFAEIGGSLVDPYAKVAETKKRIADLKATLDDNSKKVDVTLEGSPPKVAIGGLGSDDLGKLSMGDLTAAVVDKTTKYVVGVFALTVRAARVGEQRSLESKLLNAILDGRKAQGFETPALKDLEPMPGGAAPVPG